MTDRELLNFIRDEARRQDLGPAKLGKRCRLATNTIHSILYSSQDGTSIWNVVCLLKALGFHLEVFPGAEPMTDRPITVIMHAVDKQVPVMHRINGSEYACLKCGLDAGVDEVHGHLQCHHCGHILQDCCGD